jgi:hypothetical protein
MTRSAVRSRLAPPRFALRATRGAAARSPKSEAWCPAKPAGRRRAGPGYTFSIVIPGRASARTMMRNCASENPFLQTSCGAMDSGPAPIGASRNVDVILPRRPLLDEPRHALAEIAAAQGHHHYSVGVDGGSCVRYSAASASTECGSRFNQPSMKAASHARSATSCMARPSKCRWRGCAPGRSNSPRVVQQCIIAVVTSG